MKTIVYAKFGGQTKCIMGNWKIDIEDNSCSCSNPISHSFAALTRELSI